MVKNTVVSLLLLFGTAGCATTQWVVDTAVPVITEMPGFADAVKQDMTDAFTEVMSRIPYIGPKFSEAFDRVLYGESL